MKKYKIDQIIEKIGTKSYEDIKNKKILDKINIRNCYFVFIHFGYLFF